jgi:hypothetical protein
MQIIEGRLGVAIDVRNNSFEDMRIVTRLRPKLYIKILQLELLPPKVIGKATELGGIVLFSFLIVESIWKLLTAENAVPHSTVTHDWRFFCEHLSSWTLVGSPWWATIFTHHQE